LPRDGIEYVPLILDDKIIKDHYDAGTQVEQAKYWVQSIVISVRQWHMWQRQTEGDEY